ncbi:sulfurtransferase TusD [Alkanindiges hydrocarboniclasticus]|uniref:Sulfurtransferase TusD n=1 Tax=Alkanindiges hydrocarboniclasticus TaxID=1907941 RepID=A0A1S8CQH7_9GAMM|nr:sulfurtransferase complex subunit TusD [Alkanindiges hydrocarboniclasticus]ONG37622.1 sulfurtransferase TusD [Alkanindiges hydrocarboniclasticus]
MMTLLLLTLPSTSPIAWHALKLAQSLIHAQHTVQVFFYQDAVTIANGLSWRPQDEPSLGQEWQGLGIDLPVCVTAALNRGITDEDNAKRHQLSTTNLLPGFRMAGLGELADAMMIAERTLQF